MGVSNLYRIPNEKDILFNGDENYEKLVISLDSWNTSATEVDFKTFAEVLIPFWNGFVNELSIPQLSPNHVVIVEFPSKSSWDIRACENEFIEKNKTKTKIKLRISY